MKAKTPFFTVKDGVATGRLVLGLEIQGTVHKDFEMRAYTVGDLIDAEAEAMVAQVITFNAFLMTQQLVRVGTFTGPFSLNMLRRVKPQDWRILRGAQQELEAMGEPSGGEDQTESSTGAS